MSAWPGILDRTLGGGVSFSPTVQYCTVQQLAMKQRPRPRPRVAVARSGVACHGGEDRGCEPSYRLVPGPTQRLIVGVWRCASGSR